MGVCCSTAAKIFKALGDEQRVCILGMLMEGEKCACKLLEALQISQPTLSHHMKILCDAGIVEGRKEGRWMHYHVSEGGAAKARKLLEALTSGINFARDCDCKEG